MEKIHRYVPEDVMIVILSKLPIKSLIKFKAVSRNWQALITSSHVLIQSSLKHQHATNPLIIFGSRLTIHCHSSSRREGDTWIINPDSSVQYFDQTHIMARLDVKPHRWGKVSIVGSCDGLLCLSLPAHNKTSLVLLNPATRELRSIPDLSTPMHELWPRRTVNVSLGFDPIGKVYKVVLFLGFYDLREEAKEVYVFEKGGPSSSWRRLDNVPQELMGCGPIIVLDGTLYFLAIDTSLANGSYNFRIASFDLHKEEFRKFRTPSVHNNRPENLAKWRGSLVAGQFWVLEKNNNHILVWTRVLDVSSLLVLVGVWKDYLILRNQKSNLKLILYQNYCLHENPNLLKDEYRFGNERYSQLHVHGGRCETTYEYVESLVSVY